MSKKTKTTTKTTTGTTTGTTTVSIDSDEWYPVYSLVEGWGVPREVPAETVERWKRVFDEFNSVQEEMEAFYQDGNERIT